MRNVFFWLVSFVLINSAAAGQLTVGDWDFVGIESFPDYTADWEFKVDPGPGVVVDYIAVRDLGGMMQYKIHYNGSGSLTCTLTNCDKGGNLGADFSCLVPDEVFNHYLVEVLTEPVGTFRNYCGRYPGGNPTGWEFRDCYPNPFNPVTTIDYCVAEPCQVRINVYNMSGQYVTNLVNRRQGSGEHTITLDGADLASGIYTVQLEAGDYSASQRVTLLK